MYYLPAGCPKVVVGCAPNDGVEPNVVDPNVEVVGAGAPKVVGWLPNDGVDGVAPKGVVFPNPVNIFQILILLVYLWICNCIFVLNNIKTAVCTNVAVVDVVIS